MAKSKQVGPVELVARENVLRLPGFGFRVWGLGFGFKVWGLGFRVSGLRCRGLGCRA